jgi:putative peptidoglycan lipid II flippase
MVDSEPATKDPEPAPKDPEPAPKDPEPAPKEPEPAIQVDRVRPLARTALTLLPLQIVLRGGEAILPLAFAAFFGRTAETDLYYLLAAYFVFAAAVVTGAFQDSGAVPVLIEVRAREPAALPRLAGALLGYTIAVGVAVALGMGTLAALISGWASPLHRVSLELVIVMSLGTIAVGVRSFYVGILNAHSLFWAHPVGSGLGMVLTWTVLCAARRTLGVRAIPLAMLAGELLAIGVLALLTARRLGLRIAPNLDRSAPLRRIFALVRLETTGALITRINPLMDQLMAGLAGVVGGGTLVRYASDVASLPTSILQATLFPVLLTRLSHEVTRYPQFMATTRRTLVTVCALLVGLALVMTAAREPLCALLFARGAMDRAGVARLVAIVPWALAGSAPFGALLVLARAHVALQNSRIMPSMGLLNGTLNVVLNALFVGLLGLPGIALSTSVTYFVVAVVFWVRLPGPGSSVQ